MRLRHRNAWIWLAVAALSIAVTARAQSGIYSARRSASPVIQFLAAHATEQPAAANAVQRLLATRSPRVDRHGAVTGAWAAMLPVFFVGLISPLNLVSPQQPAFANLIPSAPALPSSFQRPPPQLL